MKFNKQKECPKCHYTWPFDFSFCPHCGKRYRRILGRKVKMKNMKC